MNADRELLARWKAEEQQPFHGWDFSFLEGRYHEERPPWSYEAIVRELLPAADSVLDLGTGGGEKLREFADALPSNTVATEGYAPNLPLARANLAPYGIRVVDYNIDVESRMPFDDETFALIIDRHEAYDAAEIRRVLKPGGVFFTQQVDGRDLDDCLSLFGLQSDYLHVNLENCRTELSRAGLYIDRSGEWAGQVTYSDMGALVYVLHAAPWNAPPDFSVERYGDVLLRLNRERQPLTFTIRRFYMLARK